ncbi:transcription initiation factor TFIID subunit 4 [Centropristis striata]|uniref:transcription initiation factor TFIID subunit 4 n=1 Tax=Centropristis striata TaxID=184440 RepID=UPI0027DEEFB3|nr:transcription initiation factor TFIID subunit 4 [Centropristis striata]XP_059197170.1 transcription initiation factor TFIID subunit 4 [Centropristis striata]XP_059197171.1 transcription initiation factor TFIID subunit 4 [Centropristis striata]
MATNKVVIEAQKLDSCRTAGRDGDPSVQVKVLQVPAKCGPFTVVPPPPTAAGDSTFAPPKVIPAGHGHQPTPSPVSAQGGQTSSSSVMVLAKGATPGRVSANNQPQVTKVALSQVASMNQAPTPGRTVVITVPRAAGPQPVTVTPRLPQTASPHLPANIQIPPGMMLIRSDSGQLMLVSQQALAQAQQGQRGVSGTPRILVSQVQTASAGNKSNEKVTTIRMTAPPSFQPASVQQTAVVKVIGAAPKPAVTQNLVVSERGNPPRNQAVVMETKKEPQTTVSQAALDSVKKCKNFLVTLIKLASSDSRSANMANNVRGLVRSLLEGKLEAEEFTEQLYSELKSTPQPCLVPFLKKSLPAVRRLTADPQLFIQQAATSTRTFKTPSTSVKPYSTDTGQNLSTGQQVNQQPRGVTVRPGVTLAQSKNYIFKSSTPKHIVVQSEKHFTGMFSMKQPFTQDPTRSTKLAFKDSSGSYREDDDINDVASMAGVNLREESAQILTSVVGSVVQSCQDQPFLSTSPMLSRILRTGQALGVTDIGPEVVALVSHATQEFLRGLLQKLTVMAGHRRPVLKEDLWHAKVTDVRSQLRFLEEVESLKKKRKDEEERERLLRLTRSRSHAEDPQHQQLKQRAKELQQLELAQLQQREANLTALAAIGPRKKRPLEQMESQVTLLPRHAVPRVTRVMLRDLLLCLEQDHFLCHSLTLYKAML